MARLVVQYLGDAEVQIDGAAAGRTNRVIPLMAGSMRCVLPTRTPSRRRGA